MKIRSENFKIVSGESAKIDFFKIDEGLKHIIDFTINNSAVKPQILYPTKSFLDAVIKSWRKLNDLRLEIPIGLFVILMPPDIEVYVKVFEIEGVKHIFILEFFGGHLVRMSNEEDIIEESFLFKNQHTHLCTIAESVVLFKQFADIETLELTSIRKRGQLFNCKYLSTLDKSITILDSTWFTNIIQQEGFKVRGHFALRACGEGKTQRRLVWISEFEKSGYERKAGIEKTPPMVAATIKRLPIINAISKKQSEIMKGLKFPDHLNNPS